MEKSALVYIVLTLVTVGFGFCVRNSAYTAGYLSGRRMSEHRWGMIVSRRGTQGRDRRILPPGGSLGLPHCGGW